MFSPLINRDLFKRRIRNIYVYGGGRGRTIINLFVYGPRETHLITEPACIPPWLIRKNYTSAGLGTTTGPH